MQSEGGDRQMTGPNFTMNTPSSTSLSMLYLYTGKIEFDDMLWVIKYKLYYNGSFGRMGLDLHLLDFHIWTYFCNFIFAYIQHEKYLYYMVRNKNDG